MNRARPKHTPNQRKKSSWETKLKFRFLSWSFPRESSLYLSCTTSAFWCSGSLSAKWQVATSPKKKKGLLQVWSWLPVRKKKHKPLQELSMDARLIQKLLPLPGFPSSRPTLFCSKRLRGIQLAKTGLPNEPGGEHFACAHKITTGVIYAHLGESSSSRFEDPFPFGFDKRVQVGVRMWRWKRTTSLSIFLLCKCQGCVQNILPGLCEDCIYRIIQRRGVCREQCVTQQVHEQHGSVSVKNQKNKVWRETPWQQMVLISSGQTGVRAERA